MHDGILIGEGVVLDARPASFLTRALAALLDLAVIAIGLLAVTVAAQLLIFFLMWSSFYALVRLCPACMVVWTIMWPLLWFQVVHAVQERHVRVGEGLRRTVVGNRGIVLVIGYVVAVGWLLLAVGPALFDSFGV